MSAPANQVHSGLAGIAPLFKEKFHLPFIEAMPKDMFLLNRVKQEKGSGKSYRYKVHYEGNQSAGAYEETDDFGAVGHQKYIDALVTYRLYKVEIEVTNFAIAATKGDGAYLEEFTTESKGAMRDLRHKMNRHLMAANRSAAKEFDSLGFIIDDGQVNSATGYAGITFSSHTWWKPYVLASDTPRPISISLMQNMTENLEDENRESNITGILTNRKHFNDFGNLFESQRRQPVTSTVKGGFSAIEFEDKDVISVPALPQGDMYFLDESEILYSVLQDFNTIEPSVMRDARHLVVTHYANLVCRDLRKQGRITNLV